MGIFTYLALTVSMATMYGVGAFTSDWDTAFDFKCLQGRALNYIHSDYGKFFKDRKWELFCRSVGATSACEQSDYVNEFNKPFNYVCPLNKVLTGIASINSDVHEDRRFKFQCCKITGKNPIGCHLTDYVNDWEKKMNFTTLPGKVLNGANSIYDKDHQDRRWKFSICNVQ
ncbi:dermatopontin-like [Physella acuta]|uniref:dermatopontin-like n=1 Tax=Physella acuta TaxID=109671 RepID=UPI0027DB19C3|nr:dermatopontin-like [Physella acuta]